jgi:hypothetical protein
MHRLNEIAEKLTPAQIREVEDFAESLASRRGDGVVGSPNTEHKISFEGWAGCLAHIDPEKSDKQFVREAWDAVIDKIEKAGT